VYGDFLEARSYEDEELFETAEQTLAARSDVRHRPERAAGERD
jgi:hypothetical protein